VVQLVGAELCGPNTLKVIVPVGPDPPEMAPETELAANDVPAVPLTGPAAERPGLAAPTTVFDIEAPQVLAAELLFWSPP
jgi:hypothetical protein